MNYALYIVNYFLSLQPSCEQKLIKQFKTFKIMAEENKKQEEQVLEEENLDNVAGGSLPRSMPREF